MSIRIAEDGRIVGSETYENGMTLSFHRRDEVVRMGGGTGLGRVGKTKTIRTSDGKKTYSLGIGLGSKGMKNVTGLSPNYGQHNSGGSRLSRTMSTGG